MKKANKIIQSLWIGDKLSVLEKLSICSFLFHGHEFHLYIYDDVCGVPEGTVIKDANMIVPEKKIFTGENCEGYLGGYDAFSDYFRYTLLYQYGGWWVDLDIVCIQPFDFEADYVFSSQNNPGDRQTPTTAVIKIPGKSHIAQYCLEKCTSIKNVHTIKFLEIGPHLISHAIHKFDMIELVKPWHVFMPICYWEIINYILPNENFQFNSEHYALHLWNSKWTTKEYDKNENYHKYSILEQLKVYYSVL